MGIRLELDGVVHEVVLVRLRPELVVAIDGREHRITVQPEPGSGTRSMVVDGRLVRFVRSEGGGGFDVRLHGRTHRIAYLDPLVGESAMGQGRDHVVAPMPGTVVSVECAPGDTVRSGQPMITIESMKLQQTVAAPRDGVIAAIHYAEGASFEKDAVLIALEPQDEQG